MLPTPVASSWYRSGPTRLAVLLAVGAATGCGADRADEVARASCPSAVEEAAEAAEVRDTVRLLDTALIVCRSYSSFEAELDRHPGIIGYDTATFVELRCTSNADEAVRDSPTCARVVSPTTTVPVTTTPEVVFVGDTLDGRQIEIRPGPNVEFDGEVPAIVQQTVDIAFESGCEGVVAQRDVWAARVDDPDIGDIASVYAQHAQNVAIYIGCDPGPIVPTTATTTTDA